MNLQYIKYFITLAEYKNFTRAAEKNFVVQSTFSSGIKKLEEILDCQLFYRDKRNVNLTLEGERLLPKAKELLSLWNNIETSYKNDTNKILKIGILDTIHHSDVVVPSLKQFKDLYQAYSFELQEGPQAKLLNRLKKKELDVIFIQDEELEHEHFAKSFVYEERLEVMMPASHELRDKTQLKLADLDGLPFIEHGNCVLNEEVNAAFKDRGLYMNKVFHAHHNDMLTALVSANLGVSMMARPKTPPDLVCFIPIADAEFKRDIMMVWNRKNHSQALQCFLSV
ncbi:MAG: LysR family transcriptional regulator [Bacteroidota bacterium]